MQQIMNVTDPPKRPVKLSRRAKFLLAGIIAGAVMILCELLSLAYLVLHDFRFRSHVIVTDVRDDFPNNLRADPDTIFTYVPKSNYRFTNSHEGITVEMRHNADGFRDEEPSDRTEARFQFVALGDSFTYGWLVDHGKRWDEALAKLISERASLPAASVNLGAWMSTYDQHALFLEKHLPRRCDCVIHLVYPSHIQTINRHRADVENGRIVRVNDPLLHVSTDGRLLYGADADSVVGKDLSFPFTVCLARHHRRLRRLNAEMVNGKDMKVLPDECIYQKKHQGNYENGWKLTEIAISQIADFLKSKNIPYYVVVIPRDRQLSPLEWNGQQPDAEVLETSLPQDRLHDIVTRTGWAQYVDLLPVMRAKYNTQLYLKKDPHWSDKGHALAAKVIFQTLMEQSVLHANDDN